MNKHYTVALEAGSVPSAQRICAEVRFITAVERALGSADDVRALAEANMDRFLTGIRQDRGIEALGASLNGFARHISYRESIGDGQPGNRALYAKHLALVTVPKFVCGCQCASS